MDDHDTRPPKTDNGKLINKPSNSSENKPREESLFRAIRLTAEACGSQLSSEAIMMFVSDLLPYSDEQILAGLKRCREEIKPEKGFVTFNLAVLIEKMGIPDSNQISKASAQAAWERVMLSFYTCGECDFYHRAGNVKGLDAEGHYALRVIGGSERLIHTRTSEIQYVQRQFLEAYKQAPAADYLDMEAIKRGELTSVGDILKQLPGWKES